MFDAIIEINNLVTFTAFETVICWAFGIITGLGIGTARGSTMMPCVR
jgi:hypothetical protein